MPGSVLRLISVAAAPPLAKPRPVDFCYFCYFCCFLVSLVSSASQAKKARATKRTHHPEAALLCPTRRRPRTPHGAVVRRHAAERDVWACGRGGMCH